MTRRDAETEPNNGSAVASPPSTYDEEFESDTEVVAIRVLWGREPLHVFHWDPGRPFHIGEPSSRIRSISRSERCDFVVPSKSLGARRAPLVAGDSDSPQAVLLAGTKGTLAFPDEPSMSFDAAIRSNRAHPSGQFEGAYLLPLSLDTVVRTELGALVFEVSLVRAAKPFPALGYLAKPMSYSTLLWIVASLMFHVGLLSATAAFTPPLSALRSEELSEHQRYRLRSYFAANAQREQQAINDARDDPKALTHGGTGRRSHGEEGVMGRPTSVRTERSYAVKGPRDEPAPQASRVAALNDAAAFGMIGLLSSSAGTDPEAPAAPWSEPSARGNDPLSANGNLWGNRKGDSYGIGGLGLSGIGEGGGGRGRGYGLGTIGTIGRGSGTGRGQEFGAGHHSRGPRVRMCGYRIVHHPDGREEKVGCSYNGNRLPPQIIQRIVRQNYGAFRSCYQQGLARKPDLQGRVVVRFVIGRDGLVSNVGHADELGDPAVANCITRSFYGLTFPQPEGGIVFVTYPIMLFPAA